MPILLVGIKEDHRRLSDLPRMTHLVHQGKRHLGSGFLTPDLSALSQLLYFAQKLSDNSYFLSMPFNELRSLNKSRPILPGPEGQPIDCHPS